MREFYKLIESMVQASQESDKVVSTVRLDDDGTEYRIVLETIDSTLILSGSVEQEELEEWAYMGTDNKALTTHETHCDVARAVVKAFVEYVRDLHPEITINGLHHDQYGKLLKLRNALQGFNIKITTNGSADLRSIGIGISIMQERSHLIEVEGMYLSAYDIDKVLGLA